VTRGLVCFDVDGTLVSGTSSCAWVAAALGHEVAARLETLPLVGGIAETVAWCHDHGLRPILDAQLSSV
jgi:phosphoserine phosphatase